MKSVKGNKIHRKPVKPIGQSIGFAGAGIKAKGRGFIRIH
jgi:hypothetical protein